MRYLSGGAFRRALENRLRTFSLSSSIPLVRLRRIVAFDRFLARLASDQPIQWILKGGLALQFRLGTRARTTNDMDLASIALGSSLNLWEPVFHQFYRSMKLAEATLAAASDFMTQFVDPILQGNIEGDWDPMTLMWSRTSRL